MAKLILLQQGQAVPYEISKSEIVIGRLPECDIQLNSNMVSRKHAQVLLTDEGVQIEDLGSGNGTFLNGQKIEGRTRLKNGDRVKFGPILFRYEGEGDSSADDSSARVLEQASAMGGVEVEEGDGSSTIMGAAEKTDGFGLLDVQPAAKLKAVLEISRSLAGTLDVEKLLPRILDSLFSIFPHADRGCILLRADDGKMVPRAMKHRVESEDASVRLSRTILNQVLEQKKAILSADAASDDRFSASESISALTIRSMMCAPLLNLQGEPVGVINIDTQNPLSQFKKDDLEILIAVAGQAALSYESARLLSSYVEKQKQDSEMQIARNVQRALLPDDMPQYDGYQFFATYEAAQAVGGDYYDVVPLSDGRVALAFGDVAGKGVPGALVMSRISSVVRSTVELVDDVLEAVERINAQMCAKSVEGRFVTFVLTVLDTVNHKMKCVNAGHMSPMIRKVDGSIEEFSDDSVGVPIGVMEGFPFEVTERDLAPGEMIVLYTDGVSEAMNPASELYGMDRLRSEVQKPQEDVESLGKAIREDVRGHAAGRPQNDDITMMVFGRNAN
ncbi:MAG: SpoIIE family protein phosphatase [Planctomycetaceae bacterium]|nr:SpoIIE family protein phosphatase [Planctomycetaceae bacterium]